MFRYLGEVTVCGLAFVIFSVDFYSFDGLIAKVSWQIKTEFYIGIFSSLDVTRFPRQLRTSNL